LTNNAWRGLLAAACGPLIEPDRFLLRPPKLVEAARRAQPDLDGVGLEIAILRLPGISGHRDGLVADVFHFVDRDGLGNGAAGGM